MLRQKYGPVFAQMQETLLDKRLDYMTFLTKQLNQNKERVVLEKETFAKLMSSFSGVAGGLKTEMEKQMDLIKQKEE